MFATMPRPGSFLAPANGILARSRAARESLDMDSQGPRVLLGVTGSVAAVRTPQIYEMLKSGGYSVRVVATEAALSFVDPRVLVTANGHGPTPPEKVLLRDEDEWPEQGLFKLGDPVLHVELRKWADVLVIAPLDAHTLGRLALGLSDNLLTCVYRAWDFNRPVVLAPAMNTLMWEHPATLRHLRQILQDHGGRVAPKAGLDLVCTSINRSCQSLRIVPPQSKVLACGDEGNGGLADVTDILAAIQDVAGRPNGEVSGEGPTTPGADLPRRFQQALEAAWEQPEALEAGFVDVNAGDLHQRVETSPRRRRILDCCRVMRRNMRIGDALLMQPPGGSGGELTIRYRLPRPE
jgi:phosphopantothenoylcysteine decarboxylase